MQAMLSARLQKDTGFSLYLLWVPKSENKHQVFISVACSGATLWLRVKINIAEDIKNLHCTLLSGKQCLWLTNAAWAWLLNYSEKNTSSISCNIRSKPFL